MKNLLKNKISLIYFTFQIFSCIVFFNSFFTYILIFNVCVFYALLAYVDNNKIQFWLIFLVLVGSCFYSIISLFYKNPNYYYDARKIEEGYYVIQELRIKTRQMGSLTGRDSLIEPSSRRSLYLKNINSGNYILVECSVMELECPFYNYIDRKIYIKYIVSEFYSRKYAFYINDFGDVYNESYFIEKYTKEKNIKILFIILVVVFYICIFQFERKIF